MKKTIIALALLMPLLTACNTMEGLGQDISKGGQSLERTADDSK